MCSLNLTVLTWRRMINPSLIDSSSPYFHHNSSDSAYYHFISRTHICRDIDNPADILYIGIVKQREFAVSVSWVYVTTSLKLKLEGIFIINHLIIRSFSLPGTAPVRGPWAAPPSLSVSLSGPWAIPIPSPPFTIPRSGAGASPLWQWQATKTSHFSVLNFKKKNTSKFNVIIPQNLSRGSSSWNRTREIPKPNSQNYFIAKYIYFLLSHLSFIF